MGRPNKEIDQKQFENLCGLQCTHYLNLMVWRCNYGKNGKAQN